MLIRIHWISLPRHYCQSEYTDFDQNKMLILRLRWRAWQWSQPVTGMALESGHVIWRRVDFRRMRHPQGGLCKFVTFQFLFLHVHVNPEIPFRLHFLHYSHNNGYFNAYTNSELCEYKKTYRDLYNVHIRYLLPNHRVGAGRRTCWEGSSYRSTPALTNDHTYTTNAYFKILHSHQPINEKNNVEVLVLAQGMFCWI